jgi:hypothetical protein
MKFLVLGAPDHLFSLKVVQDPVVERACIFGGTPNIRKFIARHGTLKCESEIYGRMAVKLLPIDHRTTQEAGEKSHLDVP